MKMNKLASHLLLSKCEGNQESDEICKSKLETTLNNTFWVGTPVRATILLLVRLLTADGGFFFSQLFLGVFNMTLLQSVVTEYNAQKESTAAYVDECIDCTDAADIFNYTGHMLQSATFVVEWNYLSVQDNEEHERYLASVLSLLRLRL